MILDQCYKKFMRAENEPYIYHMYSAVFMAGYYGLLRVDELAKGPPVILAKNTHIGTNKDKILFLLKSSKTHDQSSKPQRIKIYRTKERKKSNNQCGRTWTQNHCPFLMLNAYLLRRPPAARED